MAVDDRYVLARVPAGQGRALDLGGTLSRRRMPLERLGYTYVNLDLKPGGERKVQGDAHRMPFVDGAFSLVVCSDAFDSPGDLPMALSEVHRVLEPGGSFVFWAPFMHQFGGDDLYRFTPDGIQVLMDRAGFRIVSLEAAQWFFSLLFEIPSVALWSGGVKVFEQLLERMGDRLDRGGHMDQRKRLGLARSYVVVARAEGPQGRAAAPPDRRWSPQKERRPRAPGAPSTVLRDRLMLSRIPPARGEALIIDGGPSLEERLRARGYTCVGVGLDASSGPGSALKNGTRLPVRSGALSVVVCGRGLGRSPEPFELAREVRRILKPEGEFVVWAPYLDPWRGDDYFRFTPLGLTLMLRWAGFRVVSVEAPAWLFGTLAQAVIFAMRTRRDGVVGRTLEAAAYRLDRAVKPAGRSGYGFAGAYLVVARAEADTRPIELSAVNRVRNAELWKELGDHERAAWYQ